MARRAVLPFRRDGRLLASAYDSEATAVPVRVSLLRPATPGPRAAPKSGRQDLRALREAHGRPVRSRAVGLPRVMFSAVEVEASVASDATSDAEAASPPDATSRPVRRRASRVLLDPATSGGLIPLDNRPPLTFRSGAVRNSAKGFLNHRRRPPVAPLDGGRASGRNAALEPPPGNRASRTGVATCPWSRALSAPGRARSRGALQQPVQQRGPDEAVPVGTTANVATA